MRNDDRFIITSILFLIFIIPLGLFGQHFEDSPFGILDIENNAENEIYIQDLGVKWGRGSGKNGVRWDVIEKNGPLGNPGNYDWEQTDAIAEFHYKNQVNLLWTINSFNRIDQDNPTPTGNIPKNLAAYESFIKSLAERYDGDGTDDAPGSPIVNYWQIHNEVDADYFWSDTPYNYALLYTISYHAIKSVNPDAKIALSGLSAPEGLNFFENVLSHINLLEGEIDIFDFHWFGYLGSYKNHSSPSDQKSFSEFINNDLALLLGDYENYEIWITENGTHSGTDVFVAQGKAPAQSETDQAAELVKRYIFSLANKVTKIFWRSIKETASYSAQLHQNDFFDNTGLVYNGVSVIDGELIYEPNGIGEDLGDGVKKLSYFTYKKLTEKLESSDWKNIATIKESENYTFKFWNTTTLKNTYVAWWDYFESSKDSTLFTLTDLTSQFVITTKAIPNYSSGKNVYDYKAAFESDTIIVENGSVSFYLKESPIYIVEYDLPSGNFVSNNYQNIYIYPNPASDKVHIKGVDFNKCCLTCRIVDIHGKSRIVKRINNTVYVDELEPGLYFIEIWGKEGKKTLGKLITY